MLKSKVNIYAEFESNGRKEYVYKEIYVYNNGVILTTMKSDMRLWIRECYYTRIMIYTEENEHSGSDEEMFCEDDESEWVCAKKCFWM